jgi:hypothetical protein
MKWPVSEWNQEEHDGCPEHFATRSCACTCGHKGSRTLESRAIVKYEVAKPKTKKEQVEEKEDDLPEV